MAKDPGPRIDPQPEPPLPDPGEEPPIGDFPPYPEPEPEPPPPPPPPPPVVPRSRISKVNRPPEEIEITTVATGAVLPLVYGKVRIGPKVGFPFVKAGQLWAPCYWCEGEIESITVLRNNDATKGARNQATLTIDPLVYRNYLGTQTQTLDFYLSSQLGYTDTHPGIAYSVLKWYGDSTPDDITAEIEGRKIYDPRRDSTSPQYSGAGAQSLGTETTWEYSTNPALILADFHQKYRSTYEDIDWNWVAISADHCDEILGGSTKRAEIGIAIDKREPFQEVFVMLAEYALVNWYYDDTTLVMMPDREHGNSQWLRFVPDGTTYAGYIDWGNVLDQTSNSFTIEGMVEISENPNVRTRILAKDGGLLAAVSAGWGVFVNTDGTIGCEVSDGTNQVIGYSTSPLPLNTETHVACAIDRAGTLMHLYIDGVEDAASPFSILSVTGSLTNTSELRTSWPSFLTTTLKMRELRLWNDVRSGAEILANMTGWLDQTDASLIGYWPLRTGADGLTTAVDKSTGGNDGTITGGVDYDIAKSLTEADIVSGSFNLQLTDALDTPDQVLVKYTNTDVTRDQWATDIAETPSPAGGAKNPQIVAMSGWRTHEAAYRYGVIRYNKLNLINLVGKFRTFDEGLSYVRGDVLEITHSRGLTAKKFTVTDVAAYDLARYEVSVAEYQPVWTDVIQTEPTYTDTDLGSPLDFPAVTALAGLEKLWSDQTGKWHTIFEISFAGGDWQYTRGFRYRVERVSDSLILDEGFIAYRGDVTHKFATPPSSQNETWRIYVWVVNTYDQQDDLVFSSVDVTGDGKSVAPLDIPEGSLTSLEAGQFVSLTWGASGDSDLSGYIVKRLIASEYDADIIAVNDPWVNSNAVTVIDRIDATRALLSSQPVGIYRYGIRAIDRVGNVSPNPRWVEQTITAEGSAGTNVQNLRPNRNVVTSSFDATDTSADAWNYASGSPLTTAKTQAGLSGLANTASLITNPSTSNRYIGARQTLGDHVRCIAGRAFIKKDATKNYNVEIGIESWATVAGPYDGLYVYVNQSTGAQSGGNDGENNDYQVDVRETTFGGVVWLEVTLSMLNLYGIDASTWRSDQFTVYVRPDFSVAGRSTVVGNLELIPNASVADIAGSIPMINGSTTMPFQNIKFHERLGEGMVAYVDVGDSWVDRFGVATSGWPADQTEAWIHGLTATGTYYTTSEAWDTDSDRGGNWNWQASLVRVLGGASVTYQTDVATEATYPTFTSHASTAVNTEGRFAATRVTMTSADVDEAFAVFYPALMSYQGKIQTDQVSVSIIDQVAPTSFSWNVNFVATPQYWFVLTGTTPVQVALDSVDQDGGDAKAWEWTGSSWADAAASIIIYAQGN